jgi:hypothetical protein
MLTPQHQLEAISRAYVAVIAADKGLSWSVRSFDYGIDMTLQHIKIRTNPVTGNRRYVESGRAIDLQIKATTRAFERDGKIVYDLDVESYEDLRDPTCMTRRILVLHVVDPKVSKRVVQSDNRLSIEGCCFWCCVTGGEETLNARQKRIEIPINQVFSVDALTSIIASINSGGSL